MPRTRLRQEPLSTNIDVFPQNETYVWGYPTMPIPATGRKERILQRERTEYTMQMKKIYDFCLKISLEMKIYLKDILIDRANFDEIKTLHSQLSNYLDGDEKKHKKFSQNDSRRILAENIKENALSAVILCEDLTEHITKTTHFEITREERYFFGEIDNLLCSLCSDMSRLIASSEKKKIFSPERKTSPSLWRVSLPNFQWRIKQLPLLAPGDNAEYLMPTLKNLTTKQKLDEMQRPQEIFYPGQRLGDVSGLYKNNQQIPWVYDSQRITPTPYPQYFLAFH